MSRTFICIGSGSEEVASMLHALDCDVVLASTCKNAKELMRQVSPDLIIVSIADGFGISEEALEPIKDLKTHLKS